MRTVTYPLPFTACTGCRNVHLLHLPSTYICCCLTLVPLQPAVHRCALTVLFVIQQQAHVDDAKEQPDDMEAFGISLYQMEIDRVKYLLASYLRTRLRKIEKFVFHILGSEEEFSKLSSNEVAFASKYMEAVERHLKESCLDQIPDKFRGLSAATDGGNTGSGTCMSPTTTRVCPQLYRIFASPHA